MKDIEKLKHADAREYRNYIHYLLKRMGYEPATIDDERLSDDDVINDNDIYAEKNNIRYSVQTYLKGKNKFGDNEIEEAVLDIAAEDADAAIIITDFVVKAEIKEKAKLRSKPVYIWDYNDLERITE